MNNLNEFGEKFLAVYLKHWREGKLCDKEARGYIQCCFDDRGELK